MTGTPRPDIMSTKRGRIAELARDAPDMAFTNLAHHIDLDWLLAAYFKTRKDGAVGVDGQTADDYEANLMGNLRDLVDRAKSGTYVAPPVRRVHIPKAGSPGETRPLGIPTFEDKLLQRAVLMVLEPVYETDFLDVSHDFRPGRGAHGALDSLWRQAMGLGCGWIVDVDLRRFFDTIDHGHLREFLRRRVANIVLHHVLDDWFEREVRPRLKGGAFLIRYADDFVIGVAREDDARRIMDVLPRRMSKYGLTVHPEKTRLIRFQPAAADDSAGEARDRPEPRTFDFLGFTHSWGRSHRGGWVVKRKTAKGRLTRGLQAISAWCRANLHQPIALQHQKLSEKLRGHYAYYGIIGNFACLSAFLLGVRRIWRRRLSRRGRSAPRTWPEFVRLEQSYGLPPARVVHSLARRAASS